MHRRPRVLLTILTLALSVAALLLFEVKQATPAFPQLCLHTIISLPISKQAAPVCAESLPESATLSPAKECGDSVHTPWVILYEHRDYTGRSICFMGTGTSDLLGESFSNETTRIWPFQQTRHLDWAHHVSSLKSDATGWLVRSPDGQTYALREGQQDAYVGDSWNDRLTFLQILPS